MGADSVGVQKTFLWMALLFALALLPLVWQFLKRLSKFDYRNNRYVKKYENITPQISISSTPVVQ